MRLRLLSIILLFLLPSVSDAQEYPLSISDEGHLLVEVTLNDTIQANFILDTGAGAVVLSAKTFDKIADSSEKAGYFTGFRHDGDRLDGIIYKIPSVSIGRIAATNVLAGIYPPLDDYGVDGLLSLKFFEDKPFTIDFKNKKIAFLDKQGLDSVLIKSVSIPISLESHTDVSLDMFLPICLNGKVKMKAQFDTGSGYGAFVINPYFMEELSLDSSMGKAKLYTTPISHRQIRDVVLPLQSVAIGDLQDLAMLRDVSAVFREGLIYEALIGSEIFRNSSVTIDIPNRRVLLEKHP